MKGPWNAVSQAGITRLKSNTGRNGTGGSTSAPPGGVAAPESARHRTRSLPRSLGGTGPEPGGGPNPEKAARWAPNGR